MTDQRYQSVLLDTGPLVALLNVHDSSHQVCRDALNRIDTPLLTCWPVLTEAAWLLRSNPALVGRMLSGADGGVFRVLPVGDDELIAIEVLRQRYHDLSPQLADLTLYHLALRDNLDTIFTLDRRDFSVFRRPGKQSFTLLPE